MSLSDSLASNPPLMDSRRVSFPFRNRRQGPPSLLNPTFPARGPLRPRRVPSLLANITSRGISGFGTSDRLATLIWCNEAVSGSLALRLAGSFHGASTQRLLPALSASLHAGYSVGMMNTFQFIGLGWRCWRTGLHGCLKSECRMTKEAPNPNVARCRIRCSPGRSLTAQVWSPADKAFRGGGARRGERLYNHIRDIRAIRVELIGI